MRDRFPLVMIGGLLLLAVLGVFVFKGAARGSFADRLSTYRSEPSGTRALYLLAQEVWKLNVTREQQSLEAIDEKENLLLLGVDVSQSTPDDDEPQNPFLLPDGGFIGTALDSDDTARDAEGHYRALAVSPRELEQLLAHIRSGATVVYAPWNAAHNPLLEALDVHLWKADPALGLRTLEPAQPSPFTAGVERLEAKVRAYVDLPAGSIPLLQDSVLNEYVAGAVPYGLGRLIIIGAPHLATNDALPLADNAQFWRSLLGTLTQAGPAAFDEFHHGFTGDRSIAGFAARYGVQFAIAQLIFGVCLWALALRRFGRPRPPPPDARVSSADALSATSRLYREGRHHAHPAMELVRELVFELSPTVGLSPRSDAREVVDRLAERGRKDLAAALADVHTRAQTASSDADVLEIARRAVTVRKLNVRVRKRAVSGTLDSRQ